MQLIPAIDIINGHCVRLSQGDYARKTDYADNPAEIAAQFESYGYKRLHVVDLDGAKAGKVVNINVLKRITATTNLIVDFGGGIKSDEDLENVFSAGAQAVSIGSVAVKSPDLAFRWIEKYGEDKFILSADVRDGFIQTRGWTEKSEMTINALLEKYWNKGVRRVLCTDISRDGMLCGPNIELYKQIMHDFPDCQLIASGGVSSVEDIDALEQAKIPAVVFGRAIYEGRIDVKELAKRIK